MLTWFVNNKLAVSLGFGTILKLVALIPLLIGGAIMALYIAFAPGGHHFGNQLLSAVATIVFLLFALKLLLKGNLKGFGILVLIGMFLQGLQI